MLVTSLVDPKHPIDAYELRLDLKRATPLIFTLRKSSHGGMFSGSERERLALFKTYLKLAPDFVDIEYDTDPAFIQEVYEEFSQTKIIISYHNHENTPHDLEAIFSSMRSPYAYAYKLATFAVTSSDALRMLSFVKKHASFRVTGICMGQDGEITRILGKACGNFFTYTSYGEAKVVESQIPFQTLLDIYRFRETLSKQYALLGDPVHKSISPFVHNQMFKEGNIDALYTKMRVDPDELSSFAPLAKGFGFSGFSVTMPLKEKVIEYLDEIDDEAKEIGAVNTILCQQGKWKGYNTDGKGALNAIEKKIPVLGKKFAILGTGGSAKAIAYEAYKRGAIVTVLSRTLEKALDFEQSNPYAKTALVGENIPFDILVNATPSPCPLKLEEGSGFVMDINQRPVMTPFLERAKSSGYDLIFGYEMFIHQALLQYQIWEEWDADVELMAKIWIQLERDNRK